MRRFIPVLVYFAASVAVVVWVWAGDGRLSATLLAAGAGVVLAVAGLLLLWARRTGARDSERAEAPSTSSGLASTADRAAAVDAGGVVELRTLRKELERSRKEFRRLFDIVPCYITIQDRDYRIIDSNTLFSADFGQCKGMRCFRAYKGRGDICPNCPVERTFADGRVHSSEEVVVTQDGRRVEMIVYSMPVTDDCGRITAVMEVSTNITTVKDLQRQLVLVGLAVTGMAHRIKNVMMGLEGGIFVVNTGFEQNDDFNVKRGWEMVQRNATRISRIARDLLFCSKERQPQVAEGTSPKAIAREVYETFRPSAEKEGIQFDLELDDGDDAGAFDAEALHNLMSNLVANALDACRFDPDVGEKRHHITLRCTRDAEGATVVEVNDNGAGISREDSDRVFDGLFSTKGTEGTGLGLLVVQKVAREHGGGVSFESAPRQGTTFRTTLRPQHGHGPR